MARQAEAIAEPEAGLRPLLVAQLMVLAAAAALAAMIFGLDPLIAAYEMSG